MQIKKFKAGSFAAAMEQVKKELGEHALILKSQTVEDVLSPDMKRRVRGGVEITAAVEHSSEESNVAVAEFAEDIPGLNQPEKPVLSDDREIRAILYTLLSQTDIARARGLKDYQLPIYKDLLDNGIEERLVARMFERLNSTESTVRQRNTVTDKNVICSFLKRAMGCSGPIRLQKGYPRVVALVGPTGVGKTTTIAKLAAHYALKERKKVAMVSLDNYRIGAVDQLRVYGEIMEVPVEAAGDSRQFRKALAKHSDKDLIFVDTTGKTHRDPSYAGRLKDSLRGSGPMEIHLALSLSLQERIWMEVYRQFSSLKPDRVLITKFDEGVSFGSLFNFSLQTRIPYSYFTAGQRVPEDIEVANSDKVIRLIFNQNQARLGD